MKLAFDAVLARRIIRLAAPVVAAMISQTLINVADHIMVGRLPAAESVPGQPAVTFGITLLWAVGGVLSAIAVGTQALTARRHGEGDRDGTGRVLTNALAISVVLGTCASVIATLFASRLFPLISKDPNVLAVGVPFLRWRYIGVLAMVVTAAYKSFFDGLGHTHVHFVVAIVMNILNLFLGYGLIFGHFGMPKMGVEGAGIAACVSSYTGMFLIIAWSLRPSLKQYRFYTPSQLDGKMMRELLGLSGPSGMAVLVSIFGFAVFFKVVSLIDVAVGNTQPIFQSATAQLINIFQLVFISCIAYGQAVATLVGQSMGAKDYDVAERYAYEAAKIGFSIYLVFGILVALFPHAVLHLWCKDLPVIESAAPILRVLALFSPLMSIALVFMYSLYGAGNSRFVMFVELTLHLGCLIPTSWILGLTLGWGLWGAWSAMIAYVVLMAGIMMWKFATGTWKLIRI